MKHIIPISPRTLVSIALSAVLVASAYAANETVTIDITAGGGIFPFISNSAGTAQDGYTVRVGSFLSANQSTVQALGYNKLWVGDQFILFGSGTTETLLSQAGSFDPSPNLTNSSDALKGQQAWLVYSDAATLASSTTYGVATSSGADWTIPSASPWVTTIDTSDVTTMAYGTLTGTTGSDSLRTAAAPATNLYWDANGAAGRGGSGTWSSATSATAWTTSSGGASGSGPYAWGTTSGSNYYAGAGLTANFGDTAGTVTVSGTVETREGLTFEATGYTLTSGTITLAGATAANNTITVNTGTTTINSALAGASGLTKAGSSTLTLSAANTYTGTTTVNSGTLQANAANAAGSTSQVIVNNGGSFLVSASNSVNDSAAINLSGGTLALGSGVGEVVGALTLSSNSTLDLNSGGNAWITFASLSVLDNSRRLEVWNYTPGEDRIYFLDSTNLADSLDYISFYSGAGTGTFYNALNTASFSAPEVYPTIVPEPGVYFTGAILLLGMGVFLVRRKASRSENTSPSIQKIPTAAHTLTPIANL
jgi:autotransporter-associated beta strand protein